MSYPDPPPRPVSAGNGDSAALIFFQKLWDIHWDPKVNIFVHDPKLKMSKTTKGYVPTLRIPVAKSTPVAQPDNYKGIYVQGASYDALEWVVVQNGPINGAFISTADGNNNAPWTGINWVQFSSLTQWF